MNNCFICGKKLNNKIKHTVLKEKVICEICNKEKQAFQRYIYTINIKISKQGVQKVLDAMVDYTPELLIKKMAYYNILHTKNCQKLIKSFT